MTKTQRREAARAQAAELKRKQQAAERRSKIITFSALGGVLAVLLIVVLVVLLTGGDDNGAANGDVNNGTTNGADNGTANGGGTGNVVAPATARADGGIVVGPGGVAGGPEIAGVPEFAVYLDYTCGFCNEFEVLYVDMMRQMADEGTANIVMHPVGIMSDDARRIATASVWVADRSPANWFDYHVAIFEALFIDQRGASNDLLATVAQEVGVSADVADGIRTGEAHSTFLPWVQQVTQAFLHNEALANPQTGTTGTPTMTINGERFAGNWLNDHAALPAAIAAAG